MDLQDKMLPFDIKTLSDAVETHSGMLSKCVRYREMEFRAVHSYPTKDCVESLVNVYHQLGFQDAAVGLIDIVRRRHSNILMQANWLEKLNLYDDARDLYEKNNKSWESILCGDAPLLNHLWLGGEIGVLRCLNHLGNFEDLEANALRLKRYIKSTEQQEDKATWLSQLKPDEKVNWMSQIQHLVATHI
jgi:hypothetical protein